MKKRKEEASNRGKRNIGRKGRESKNVFIDHTVTTNKDKVAWEYLSGFEVIGNVDGRENG